MPNKPDLNNRVLSVRISRELYRKLQLQAVRMGIGFNKFLRVALAAAVDGVSLANEDYAQIEKERNQDIEARDSKRRRRKT